jgi:hypothetical protein
MVWSPIWIFDGQRKVISDEAQPSPICDWTNKLECIILTNTCPLCSNCTSQKMKPGMYWYMYMYWYRVYHSDLYRDKTIGKIDFCKVRDTKHWYSHRILAYLLDCDPDILILQFLHTISIVSFGFMEPLCLWVGTWWENENLRSTFQHLAFVEICVTKLRILEDYKNWYRGF